MQMKKMVLIIVGSALVFTGLVYWSASGGPETFRTCELVNYEDAGQINFRRHDSVRVAANIHYLGDGIKEFMQGAQYRKAWATPVSFPIVFLDTLYGGMKIIKTGGGKQTHSLELQSAQGGIYALRSINKDPEPLIPETLRQLGLENIVIDGISAQHPYAAIAVARLAEVAGVLHTHPGHFFVPKQQVLGKFNEQYGNRIYLLEYETDGPATWTGYDNAMEIMDTEELQELKLQYGSQLRLDEAALVRARLFDLLIGDWDRHAKQWGWVVVKEDSLLKAIPLPTDRDNAFFNIEGVLPTILSDKNILPALQKFKSDIDYLPGLVMPFDQYFLKGIPAKIFTDEARTLQDRLSIAAISQAFTIWPDAIYHLDGEEIIAKIADRRDKRVEFANEFKKVLDTKAPLEIPLKGSENLDLDDTHLPCFDCITTY
jgi:hypothetical protein